MYFSFLWKHSFDSVNSDWTRELWGKDLEVKLISRFFYSHGEMLSYLLSRYTCNRLQESKYRILHRLQHTPHFLHKMNPQISEDGTYFHCIWQCPLISRFWNNVSKELSSVFHRTVALDPALFLLSISTRQLSLSAGQLALMCKPLLLAKGCVLFQWIQEKHPSVSQYRETGTFFSSGTSKSYFERQHSLGLL